MGLIMAISAISNMEGAEAGEELSEVSATGFPVLVNSHVNILVNI